MENCHRGKVDNVNKKASEGKKFTYKTKVTGKTEARPAQPRNEWDFNQSAQTLVPTLNLEDTIRLK